MNGITLGERLKALRGTRSQASFGKDLGVSQPTVRNYENNDRLPDTDFIKNVCNRYNVTADWVLFGKESDPPTADAPSAPALEKTEAPRPDVRDDYIAALRQLADLQKENGDLRVKAARLEARNAELERLLVEAHKGQTAAPVGGEISKAG